MHIQKIVEMFYSRHDCVNKCSHKWSEIYMTQDKDFKEDCKGLVLRNQTGT